MKQNTYSLSWFKKRTAQINVELRGGRKSGRITFSPTAEYKKQQAAAARGDVTPFVRMFGGAGDYRSAAGRAAVSKQTGASLYYIWEPFANANKIARAILDHLGDPFVEIDTRTGKIYRKTVDDAGKVHYIQLLDHGHERAVRGRPPASLQPLTNETASRALAKKATDVKKRTARTASNDGGGGGALGGYQDL